VIVLVERAEDFLRRFQEGIDRVQARRPAVVVRVKQARAAVGCFAATSGCSSQ